MLDGPIDLDWRGYALKMALALVWILVASVAGGSFDGNPMVIQIIATALLVAPPLVWMTMKWRAIAKLDEMQASLELKALVRGMLVTSAILPALFAVNVLLASSGIVPTFAFQDAVSAASRLVWVQPAFAFLFSEGAAQNARVRYAKGADA